MQKVSREIGIKQVFTRVNLQSVLTNSINHLASHFGDDIPTLKGAITDNPLTGTGVLVHHSEVICLREDWIISII
jgi:hypothetical protein